MAVIDPFRRYKPLPVSRGRKTKLPSLRTTFLVVILLLGALSFKTSLMNQYNFLKGLKYWSSGDLELAKMEFNKVLTRSPGNAKAIDGLGMVEIKEAHLDKAKDLYDQAMKAGLSFSRRFNHLKTGQSFIDAGQYTEAELELQHALELQPNNPNVYIALGTAERALGQVAKGEKYYETALSQDPKNKKYQQLVDEARGERDRGSIYYIYDRNGQPLALQWLKNGEKGYPMGKEFAHLIGYVDQSADNNRGSAGLESVYQNQFPGNKLYLTIDSRIQSALFKAMGWEKGSIVVLNPRTGEILGCVSQPTFTPEKIHSDWWSYVANKNQPLKNRAFEGLYEPGSIVKIVSSAAAVETNLNLNQVFPLYCKGYEYIDGKVFYDWQKHKTIHSLEEAFDASCNVSYAKLGFALGEDKVLEFNNRFGFNSIPKTLSIPVSMSFSPKLGLSQYELAQSATGLGDNFRITPLNAALLAAAIANDGVMMSPYLVQKLTNIDGKVLQENKPLVYKNTISRQTAGFLTAMMLNDVERGIGAKARIPGLKIAGKTGTSGSRNPNFHAWFICFAPVENPKIAVAVLAENGGTGKDVAAPIAKKAIEGIMEVMDLNSGDNKK
ncbi:MAG TPA: penicillin-binding transpeptidase domain-containing protein [bacterium]|nr:penicillin-binding transpeptidase domain-containing protein [bacterium]